MLHLLYLFIVVVMGTAIHANESAPVKEEKKAAGANEKELTLKPNQQWKDKEIPLYRTPSNATKGVKGIAVPYTFWYDHFVWTESEPLNVNAEKSFKLLDGYAYAIIVTDKGQFYIDDLDDIVIKNAKESGFENATIVSDEKRIVNDREVLSLHWKAMLQGIQVDFLSYMFSDPEGSVFIHTYTPTFLFKENRKKMESFLNGFSIDKKKKTSKN